jgi:hypothetical protein
MKAVPVNAPAGPPVSRARLRRSRARVVDAVARAGGEPAAEPALGPVIGEVAHLAGDFDQDGLHDVVGVGIEQAASPGQREEVAGVEIEEPVPGGLVAGIADRPQHTGACLFKPGG